MASSYRQRSSSPYRGFHKPASVDGQLTHYLGQGPNYTGSGVSSFSNSSHTATPRGRSLTPTRVRAMPPSTFKFKFGSPPVPSSARPPNSVGFSSPGLLSSSTDGERENVLVTVRFRPLSLREVHRGDEVAWYADGDTTVRSEYNPSTAYAFDRVFGPATTTRAVYDAAARLVVRGAMEGVNGTVFAYGVTSSGKTHTMHGDQKSPGIIPLAVKDVFNIIQDTPGREYLLRVSYLEIYNEVINDLLDPTGQNLRIREDSQGTYVEGVKEEVVLSPAHALSLIAAGEEHRHVGSNNFNLLSSRSHTIFTLNIESSLRTGDYYDDEVIVSQLNLIDLAGSESSKTETTGLRRKEGSYINKSLLTLGTVIGKLSDGKASHVPYRDSKLTRLLQSSLNGFGRVSLICTLTPASSNIEETHNTLKFAHRAKRVALHATPNRMIDEKSLIKKYQKEISSLRQELEHLKRGIFDKSSVFGSNQEDLLTLRQQLEAGQVKLQSRLEEEEQAKAALLGRIQRLTKLILVSTKTSTTSQEQRFQGHRRRHSFGEENNNGILTPSLRLDIESSPSASPASAFSDVPVTDRSMRRRSLSQSNDEMTPVVESFKQATQAGELFSIAINGRKPPPTGETMTDQMDLLREQVKMLAGEVAFSTSSLKRVSEQAANSPDDIQIQVQMKKIKDEIQEKKRQIHILEQRIVEAGQAALNKASPVEMSETISKLMGQLNEKDFELEIRTADNRILQEQLQTKISEIKKLQEVIASTQQKPMEQRNYGGAQPEKSDSRELSPEDLEENRQTVASISTLQNQLFIQAAEVEKLKQEKVHLMEESGGLKIQCQKLAEEASYAQELASAAAVELKNLADEVTKLSLQNSKLTSDLIKAQEAALYRMSSKPSIDNSYFDDHKKENDQMFTIDQKDAVLSSRGFSRENEVYDDIDSWKLDPQDVKRELHARKEREASLEAALADKEQVETDLRKKLEEAKQREADLENDLAGMWVLVAKLKNERRASDGLDDYNSVSKGDECFENDKKASKVDKNSIHWDESDKGQLSLQGLQSSLKEEKRKSAELETMVSRLKGEDLEGLGFSKLEELQNLHMEALTKICQAKAKNQQSDKEREFDQHSEERSGHICKVCFEAPTAAVLLPCRHFCLCKPCAVACSECPLCRSGIADRIITFTS